jgi:hypothetical protein
MKFAARDGKRVSRAGQNERDSTEQNSWKNQKTPRRTVCFWTEPRQCKWASSIKVKLNGLELGSEAFEAIIQPYREPEGQPPWSMLRDWSIRFIAITDIFPKWKRADIPRLIRSLQPCGNKNNRPHERGELKVDAKMRLPKWL